MIDKKGKKLAKCYNFIIREFCRLYSIDKNIIILASELVCDSPVMIFVRRQYRV